MYCVGACTPSKKEPAAAAGKAILATRGECTFIEKAEATDAGPGMRVGALIITNSETSLFHMGAAPRCVKFKEAFGTDM